jgi:hypothetical protein
MASQNKLDGQIKNLAGHLKTYTILYTISYTILHTILVHLTDDLYLSVLQAVGRLGRRRGKEDIDIHVLKPAHFAVDPLYSIPRIMSANIVQDDRLDPGEEYLTYRWKMWNFAKRGCRNPGHVALRLIGAGVMQPVQREVPLRSE